MIAAVNAGTNQRIAALPLAVTLAVHVLLVLAWLATRGRPLEHDAAPPVSVLIQVPLPKPREARPLPKPAPRPEPITLAPPAARPIAPVAPAQPITPPHEPPPQAADSPKPAPHSNEADDLLGTAKRQAGAIDRELRGGKPGVPREADAPFSRFRDGVASAHIDRSNTSVEDSYTSPDGTTTYRLRQGDKVRCRAGGGVVPDMVGRSQGALLAGAGHFDTLGRSNAAGRVNCPSSDRDWVHH